VRPSEVVIGMKVHLLWRDIRDGVSVPLFSPG
jgi:uncharacterized OB-fold protein